jgi:hypothetical protein
MRVVAVVWASCVGVWCVGLASGATPAFRIQELDARLTVGYAVTLVDMNADKRPDIVVVDSKRVVWFENPAWKMHALMEAPDKTDNVCIAVHDIDGDGRPDFALGADWVISNTRSGGTLQWFSPNKPGKTDKTAKSDKPAGAAADAPWQLHPIGTEPTIHRIRWIDLDGDGRQELVVVPLLGRNSTAPNYAESAVRVLAYRVPKDPVAGPWKSDVLNDEMHVAHNFTPADVDRDGRTDLLVTSFEGVNLLRRSANGKWTRTVIGEGNQQTRPNRGASEIKLGKLAGNRDYIATIEPWHGHQVVVYTPPDGADAKPSLAAEKKWTRHVVDEQLLWGHAVWCANLDDDEDQELLIGVRDDKSPRARRGLRIYDPAGPDPAKWTRTEVDPGGVAIEDLAAADLDGDGRVDVVAVGRQTHNVRIYWNRAAHP